MTEEERLDIKRSGHLRRTYGITLEQYNALLERQDGKCPICLRHHTEFPINLSVDHDHVSMEIRGLLCTYCNRRVVGRHRDPDLLDRVAAYLRLGTGWYAPKKKRKRSVKKK